MPSAPITPPLRAIKASGLLLVIVGLVLAIDPALVYDAGPATSTYDAIERRIWWGGLLGLGVLLSLHNRLQPWRHTLSAAVLWLVGGMLVARFIGLARDGYDSVMQWFWMLVEIVVIALAGMAMRRYKPDDSPLPDRSTP